MCRGVCGKHDRPDQRHAGNDAVLAIGHVYSVQQSYKAEQSKHQPADQPKLKRCVHAGKLQGNDPKSRGHSRNDEQEGHGGKKPGHRFQMLAIIDHSDAEHHSDRGDQPDKMQIATLPDRQQRSGKRCSRNGKAAHQRCGTGMQFAIAIRQIEQIKGDTDTHGVAAHEHSNTKTNQCGHQKRQREHPLFRSLHH